MRNVLNNDSDPEFANAQAGLKIRWAHMFKGSFSDIVIFKYIKTYYVFYRTFF